jgi:ESS family glutamate:Na+ symporter
VSFWSSPVVVTTLLVALLLATSEGLRAAVKPIGRLGVPACIFAGVLGLAFGPDGADLLPFDRDVLESTVYHGLAVVFIAVGLQRPTGAEGGLRAGITSFSFGIPFMEALQAFLGLAVVLLLGLVLGEALHPGLGLMLPLGFEQGPGQALSLGAAWEEQGMPDGAQIGLITAALGFLWSIVVGVPLVWWGRRKGLIAPRAAGADGGDLDEGAAVSAPGSVDPLTLHAAVIAVCYGFTWLICLGLSRALAGMPDIAATVWGFHFIVGAGVAMGARAVLARAPGGSPLRNHTLGRISGFSVDWMTCAALAAVQLGVLQANWLPLLLVTSLGGLVTLWACVWLAARAFPDAPFEHCVVWFGMSTGTLPMGLALLRMIDPDLRSPASLSAVLGSAGAIAGAVPVLMVLIPLTVAAYPEGYPSAGWIALVAAGGYCLVLLGLWWTLGPLSMKGRGIWPTETPD